MENGHYSHKVIMLEVTVGQEVNIFLVHYTLSKPHYSVTGLSTVM